MPRRLPRWFLSGLIGAKPLLVDLLSKNKNSKELLNTRLVPSPLLQRQFPPRQWRRPPTFPRVEMPLPPGAKRDRWLKVIFPK